MTEKDEQDDLLFLRDDDVPSVTTSLSRPWTILVVDDDDEVHVMTELVLRDMVFEDRPLQLVRANSATEAKARLSEHDDISLILLDVVMETDDAGLRLVHHIRRELNNNTVRIILRTGQAGYAPERRVILDYDINDYKEKTELTSQKLITAVVGSLRSYNLIKQVVGFNQQLEEMVQQRTKELESANLQLKASLHELEEGEKAGSKLQFKLLPKKPDVIGGIHFDYFLQPSHFMSGDFVDYFAIDDTHIGFYLADVAGHGVSSAFLTVYLKRFVSASLTQYQQGESALVTDPPALLAELNDTLIKENLGKHIALFYAVINTARMTLTFTNAGIFPWPVIYQGDQMQALVCKGTPAGLFDFAEYTSHQLSLSAPFSLYVFSDGILECIEGATLDEQINTLSSLLEDLPTDLNDLAQKIGLSKQQHLPDDFTLLRVSR